MFLSFSFHFLPKAQNANDVMFPDDVIEFSHHVLLRCLVCALSYVTVYCIAGINWSRKLLAIERLVDIIESNFSVVRCSMSYVRRKGVIVCVVVRLGVSVYDA